MKHPGKTKLFRGQNGGIITGSIAEVNYLRLGGLDQWVMIRGKRLTNLPLVLLHTAGRAGPRRLFSATSMRPLEKTFTVVYWDQRGSGKSFDSKIPRSSMTVR